MDGLSLRDILTKAVHHSFSEKELKSIVSYCMDETILKNINLAISYLRKDLYNRLSFRVPVFMSKFKKLMDYLND